MSSNSVTYRNQKPLGPASIGENAADRVCPVSSGARNGLRKFLMSAARTGRSVEARGDEMAVSCIRLSKNINRLGSAGLPAVRRTGAAVPLDFLEKPERG